ncbi:transaldolase [Luteibacter aegosomatissinici]|uniref:transaldolase n=1 Tax=Luteibacter aegosomatissinici TaxID=2911539 RepID=UPI001FFBD5F9|nr:transaldolase [Luteibacter aegosomatissinici]UPG94901.1 transaldolase [Luteibacter aegosomatissinici]
MTSQLEQLRKVTKVVADTGDMSAMKTFKPEDATTNPSLLLKAAGIPEYAPYIDEAVKWAKEQSSDRSQQLIDAGDRLAVLVGREILKIVPGYVSTEVDARLSFDTEASITKAKRLIGMYKDVGVDPKRVLIKLASTWEGIKAAEVLQKEGINCNMTLLFSFEQAVACAEAGAFLISPFVGRIFDWYVKNTDTKTYAPAEDPGVKSVQRIYKYYKDHGYKTIVMGASFRNIGQIQALAGCDRLTISPDLLKQLDETDGDLPLALKDTGKKDEPPKNKMTEAQFRWGHNEDAMATDKLGEGIRNFAKDQRKLEELLGAKL